jgi:hypothetical protein
VNRGSKPTVLVELIGTSGLPVATAYAPSVEQAIVFITQTRVHPRHVGRITFGYRRGATFKPYEGHATVYVPRWTRRGVSAA